MKIIKYYIECMTSLKDFFTGKATKVRLKEYLRGIFIYIQYIALFVYSFYITRSWSTAVIMLLMVIAIVCIHCLWLGLAHRISKRKAVIDETQQTTEIEGDNNKKNNCNESDSQE